MESPWILIRKPRNEIPETRMPETRTPSSEIWFLVSGISFLGFPIPRLWPEQSQLCLRPDPRNLILVLRRKLFRGHLAVLQSVKHLLDRQLNPLRYRPVAL